MSRPSWDTYFMRMAHLASTRSTCVRRKVGAVIVKDRMVLTTGYNDTPRGVRNCGDGGCARCAGDAPSGTGHLLNVGIKRIVFEGDYPDALSLDLLTTADVDLVRYAEESVRG